MKPVQTGRNPQNTMLFHFCDNLLQFLLLTLRNSPTRKFSISLHTLSLGALTLLVIARVASAQSGVSLVSMNGTATGSGDAASQLTAISADGRYVAFTSTADDLVPGVSDTNHVSDVFLRDRMTGTTYAVSVRNGSNSTGNGASGALAVDSSIGISADGRYVVYSSLASDIVPNDTNGAADVFVFDRLTGLNTLVSSKVSDPTAAASGASVKPVISANGRVVVFLSSAPDLSQTSDTNGAVDIYARNLDTGITKLVTINYSGNGAGNDLSSGNDIPSISDDGRFVAFDSAASNLVTNDTNGGGSFGTDVFVRDLQNDKTILVSANSSGTGSGNLDSFTSDARISGNGRFVVFESRAYDLVTGINYPNVTRNIFIRDLNTNSTAIASVNNSGTAAGADLSQFPAVSYDGRFVAFTSRAGNLVDHDTNNGLGGGITDIFIRDVQNRTTNLVSINSSGTDSGNSSSLGPVEISRDGRFVLFVSNDSDLTTTTDTNAGPDVFMRDLLTGSTILATVNTSGVAGGANSPTTRIALSDDYVATFESKGRLISTDANGQTDIFAYVPPGINAIDNPPNFVRQHYRDFLGREADQSGLDFWTGQMTSCGSSDLTVCRVNVSGAFFLSIEFQQTGYLVERMYKTAYGDATATSTFGGSHQIFVPVVRINEFLADTQRVGRGVVVGQPGWDTVLENNKQAYALEFVQTSRFAAALPTTMTPTQFVDKLNANAGNVLSPSERATAIGVFGTAADTSNVAARAQVLRQIADDSDLFSAESNRAFVLAQYFGYLRRNPNDLPDSDYTGYEFWLLKLNQFNGDYIGAEMVKAFINSSEYRQRFGQP
jgi:hypothetical protein